MRKGIIWLPIALGIILLVEILVFSIAFTKVTTFSREVQDSNIVFEGDELETYARSLGSSVQIAISQSLYDFYRDHTLEVWQRYGTKSVPDEKTETSASTLEYMKKFIQSHIDYPGAKGDVLKRQPPIIFETVPSGGDIEIVSGKGTAYAAFVMEPQMLMKKELGKTVFEKEFSVESRIRTAFGEMMRAIREDIVNADVMQKYVVAAVRRNTQAEADKCPYKIEETEAEDRSVDRLTKFNSLGGVTDGATMRSYLDEHPRVLDPEIAKLQNSFEMGIETIGTVKYCEIEWELMKVPTGGECQCDDPCPGEESYRDNFKLADRIAEKGDLYGRPAPGTVYRYSHTETFESGAAIIKQYAEQRLVCLETVLDKASDEYTVAFDGENRGADGKPREDVGPMVVQTAGEVKETACSIAKDGSGATCRVGVAGKKCGTCPTPGGGERPKHLYRCPYVYEETCNFNHYAAGSADVRVQEDGFLHAFWDKKLEKEFEDSFKLVFRIISGNKELI